MPHYTPQPITSALIKRVSKWPPPPKPKEIRDRSAGLILRHQPSGYLALYAELGRGKRERLYDAAEIIDTQKSPTLARAKERAKILRGESAGGRDFKAERQDAKAVPTLAAHLDADREGSYGWWLIHNRKDGANSLLRLKRCFEADFGRRKLDALTIEVIDTWRSRRLRKVTPETVNRDIGALIAALNKMAEWRKSFENPLKGLKPAEVDRHKRTLRRLYDDEVGALRSALTTREDRIRRDRDSGNQWREHRRYELLPSLDGVFVDALRPAIEISLETGMRRGELLSLTWDMVDLRKKVIYLPGEVTKSYLTRTVPLNALAANTLRQWQLQQGRPTSGYVFPGVTGRLTTLKKSFYKVLADAGIDRESKEGRVSWHSLRHTFGSRLGDAGVDPETLRELMGHAHLSTTQRYLRSREDRKKEAVARLVQP